MKPPLGIGNKYDTARSPTGVEFPRQSGFPFDVVMVSVSLKEPPELGTSSIS
jgi:hypothetical protein